MKIAFVSNYFNHHQKPFCDALYNMQGIDFHFISTTKMRDERKKMGYDKIVCPDYVIHGEDGEGKAKKGKEIIFDADIVIAGFPPIEYINKRIKKNKLTFYCAERILRDKKNFLQMLKIWLAWKKRIPKNKKVYLLAPSAYSAFDFERLGIFTSKKYNKAFKWGYFPNTVYELDMSLKKENTILCCGRLLALKCPMDILKAAFSLKEQGYSFKLKFVGEGEMENEMRAFISEKGLGEYVEIAGFMPPEQVRKEMDRASIYLFTSNKKEGWGAVLNESMNSGCAVISSHAVGAAPFLIKDGENGLIYRSGDVEMLTEKLKYLLDNPQKQKALGEKAYLTITEKWNAEEAAKRFVILAKTILNGNKSPDIFPDGPCSRAEITNDEWY